MKTYEINNSKLIEFLNSMNFDSEDIQDVIECQEKDPNHMVLLTVSEDSRTIAVTPSDADVYFYILRNENAEEIISETLSDIQKYIDSESIIEL
jgi:tRNA1(Val) A37 N6-methylase TrmN6